MSNTYKIGAPHVGDCPEHVDRAMEDSVIDSFDSERIGDDEIDALVDESFDQDPSELILDFSLEDFARMENVERRLFGDKGNLCSELWSHSAVTRFVLRMEALGDDGHCVKSTAQARVEPKWARSVHAFIRGAVSIRECQQGGGLGFRMDRTVEEVLPLRTDGEDSESDKAVHGAASAKAFQIGDLIKPMSPVFVSFMSNSWLDAAEVQFVDVWQEGHDDCRAWTSVLAQKGPMPWGSQSPVAECGRRKVISSNKA